MHTDTPESTRPDRQLMQDICDQGLYVGDLTSAELEWLPGEIFAFCREVPAQRVAGAAPTPETVAAAIAPRNDTKPADAPLQGVKGTEVATTPRRAAQPAGAPPEPMKAGATTREDTWLAEYEGSAEIRGEFPNAATYVSFRKAEARGAFRIHRGHRAGVAAEPARTAAAVPSPDAHRSAYEAPAAAGAALRAEFPTLEVYAAYVKATAAGRARLFRGHVIGGQR